MIAATWDDRQAHTVVTRCAYAQGRVKRLSPSIYVCVCMYVCVCVCVKNTEVCCLTARKSPRNSSLPLGLAIYILRKMPTKSDESSVECYGHGFLIAARPRGGIEHYGNSIKAQRGTISSIEQTLQANQYCINMAASKYITCSLLVFVLMLLPVPVGDVNGFPDSIITTPSDPSSANKSCFTHVNQTYNRSITLSDRKCSNSQRNPASTNVLCWIQRSSTAISCRQKSKNVTFYNLETVVTSGGAHMA